jgi:two-component system LytT family response regulator
MVRVGTRDVLVRVNEIDWIEADTYCAQLHVGPRTFVHRERMHVLETHLDPSVFVRVHRSAIVNLARVKEIVHEGGEHVIVLSTGARVRASHTRWLEFRDAMRQRASTG